MKIKQLFKTYIIIFITLTFLRLLSFESMVTSVVAMLLAFNINKYND